MRHLRVAALVMSILLVGVLAVLAPAAQAHPQRHVHPRPSPSPSVSLLPSVPPSPSLSPSLSASASSSPTGSPLINCWPTPHTCGYPDASNTGVPAGHTLTTVNGDVMLSTPGQVYQDREVNGCVNVTATGVTIQFVKVHCSSVEAISHFDLGVRDSTPLKVLDSEVDCLGTVGVTGIGDTNVDAERDDISQCENGFDLDQWDTVRDNYGDSSPSSTTPSRVRTTRAPTVPRRSSRIRRVTKVSWSTATYSTAARSRSTVITREPPIATRSTPTTASAEAPPTARRPDVVTRLTLPVTCTTTTTRRFR